MKFKLFILLVFISILSSNLFGQNITIQKINNIMISSGIKIEKPIFADSLNNHGDDFSSKIILNETHFDFKHHLPKINDTIPWDNNKWTEIKNMPLSKESIYYAITYLQNFRWINAKLKITANCEFAVFINDEKIANSTNIDDTYKFDKDLDFLKDKHQIRIKMYAVNDTDLNLDMNLEYDKKYGGNAFNVSLSPKRYMKIEDIMLGEKVNNASISSDGKYALINYSQNFLGKDKVNFYKIYDLENDIFLPLLPNGNISNVKWHPTSNSVSYKAKENNKYSIYLIDIKNGNKVKLIDQISDIGDFRWSPDARKIIYEEKHLPKEDDNSLRRFIEIEDRHPWWRNRSYLFEYDLITEITRRLTWGYLSTTLHDISITGQYVLFSTERPQYNTRQYAYQNMYILNTETMETEIIWEDKSFPCQAMFSPDENNLLILGGPSAFGEIGENIPEGIVPNNYDTQAYLYDLKNTVIKPITKDFNPKILNAHWNLYNNKIYFLTQHKTFNKVFEYDLNKKMFRNLELNYDYISEFSFANKSSDALLKAESMQTPKHIIYHNIENGNKKVIADPENGNYKNVEFGKTKNWDYISENNDTIMGRVYYPPNFDNTKKYPLIVYYYGGTNPVSRTFGGRYPFNIFAAQGYIVYVLQPSGATGFGQEFSARHVNNWGKTVADEIINGTKYFLDNNSYCDPAKVGCIGASYGGFMTMLLQTRTDIFSAAISHAGISSISSYWGEGYWGYLYSSEASANSFPWNNPELYIDQSPLFAVDKVKTPILLLHGDVDTNVPVGESIQFYTALKLLGKPVELVTIKDTDHHVLMYQHRIDWNNSIFAWFDKWLKNQPEWWNAMFPQKKY